jgi:hypothetical protein
MPAFYPLSIQTFILQVSGQLNDQEGNPNLAYPAPGTAFVRWSVAELIGYLNDAILEVAFYRPDQFTNTYDKVIDATNGGTKQYLSQVDRLLIAVNSNGLMTVAGVTADCPGAPVVQCDLALMRTFFKAPCNPTGGVGDYRVLTYAYDAKKPNEFYVSPPVPAGGQSVVNITTVQDPIVYTTTDYTAGNVFFNVNLDPKFYNALKFFVMGRAYEVDTESGTSQAESEKFYRKFYNTLGVAYKQTGDYNKGKFLGQGGSSQMTIQRKENVP